MKALPVYGLERDLIALQEMKTPALQQKWREVFKSEPPAKMRAGFLQRAIAYRLQEATFGGLKSSTKKELQRLALAMRARSIPALAGNSLVRTPARTLSPGTQLMREWNGAIQRVDVVSDGFVWKGQSFRTLSAVAVAITGTKWSGPKFFGLYRKPGTERQALPSADPRPTAREFDPA